MLRIENYSELVGEKVYTKNGTEFQIMTVYPSNMLETYAMVFKAESVIVGTNVFELHLFRKPDYNVMPELAGMPIYKIIGMNPIPTQKNMWHPFGVTKGIIKDKAQFLEHIEKYIQSCL